MASFHQIGHDCQNLMFEDALSRFGGTILSPLNYKPASITAQLQKLREKAGFVTLFDPHLYRPQSDRMCLPDWNYYPKDVETADFSDDTWWDGIVDGVARTGIELGVSAVASPAIMPRTYPDEFYLRAITVGNRLEATLRGSGVQPFQTAIVNLPDLATPARALTIASLLSRSRAPQCLLVIVSDTDPRRELADPEELKGAMRLISTLESGGQKVTVAYCAADMILWKAAGATNCASGKHFNLRRFTIARFEEPEDNGGGTADYWFEEALLCFLRQTDLFRVRDAGLLSASSAANPFGANIWDIIPTKKRWLKFAWRQFLYWFADTEYRLTTGAVSSRELIEIADGNWGSIKTRAPRIYMEEIPNDGNWVRQWLRAVEEFPYFR